MSTLALSAALALAHACAPTVAPGTLLSVAATESGAFHGRQVTYYSTAIHVNPLRGQPKTEARFFPATDEEAARIAAKFVAEGRSVDAGLGQVNNGNWTRLGLTALTVFDPCRNLRAAATVIQENYHGGDTPDAQQAELRRTLSAYNAGPRGAFQAAYVRRVEAAAAQIVPEIRVPGVPALPAQPAPQAAPDPTEPPAWDVWAHEEWQERKNAAPPSPTGADAASVVIHEASKGDTE